MSEITVVLHFPSARDDLSLQDFGRHMGAVLEAHGVGGRFYWSIFQGKPKMRQVKERLIELATLRANDDALAAAVAEAQVPREEKS